MYKNEDSCTKTWKKIYKIWQADIYKIQNIFRSK